MVRRAPPVPAAYSPPFRAAVEYPRSSTCTTQFGGAAAITPDKSAPSPRQTSTPIRIWILPVNSWPYTDRTARASVGRPMVGLTTATSYGPVGEAAGRGATTGDVTGVML